jgi:hypothetical protein
MALTLLALPLQAAAVQDIPPGSTTGHRMT